MKPFINLNELGEMEEYNDGAFGQSFAVVSDKIGAQRIGYNVTIVPPGKKSCPFHNHHVNEEMFLILEGNGLLRFGEKEYLVKKHDISCPPGGRDVAHQIINNSDSELKYLALSTKDQYEICEYPDSNKVQSLVGDFGDIKFKHMAKIEDAVSYMEGES